MFNRFDSILLVSPIPGGKEWVVREPFAYTTDIPLGQSEIGPKITVEERFVTDFASIPRIFWFFLPRWGKYGNASVVHDYLYWVQETSRLEADLIMYEAMEDLEVNWLVRGAIYTAVRIGGGMSWNRNTKDQKDPTYSRIISQEAYNQLVGRIDEGLEAMAMDDYQPRPPIRQRMFSRGDFDTTDFDPEENLLDG